MVDRGHLNRRWGAVAALVSAIFVVLALRETGAVMSDGPYPRTDAAGIDFELAPGVPATWGMPLPGSLRESFVLRSIEPLGVEGLDVLGVYVCRWSGAPDDEGIFNDCTPAASRTWPPAETTLLAVDGTVVAGEPSFVSMVIGVERHAGTAAAKIASIRIVYTTNGDTHEVIEPWTLNLIDPGTLSWRGHPAGPS